MKDADLRDGPLGSRNRRRPGQEITIRTRRRGNPPSGRTSSRRLVATVVRGTWPSPINNLRRINLKRYGGKTVLDQPDARDPRARIRHHPRAKRMRKIHRAWHHRGSDSAHLTARSGSTSSASTACRRRSAVLAWCSRTMRCFRTSTVFDNVAFGLSLQHRPAAENQGTCRCHAWSGSLVGIRGPLSWAALWRPAAARRHCARSRPASAADVARRAACPISTPSCAWKCAQRSSSFMPSSTSHPFTSPMTRPKLCRCPTESWCCATAC